MALRGGTRRSTGRLGVPLALTVAALGLAIIATASSLVQTTIPLSIDATIDALVLHHRSDPATQFWTMDLDDGRTLIVDPEVGRALDAGAHVTKAAWSLDYQTDGDDRSLPVPTDTFRVALAGGLLAVLVGVVAFRRGRIQRLLGAPTAPD